MLVKNRSLIFSRSGGRSREEEKERDAALTDILRLPLWGYYVSILLGFVTHFPNIIDLILTQAIPPAFVVGFAAALPLVDAFCFYQKPFDAVLLLLIAFLPAVPELMAFGVIPVTTTPALQVGLFILAAVLPFVFKALDDLIFEGSKLDVRQFLGLLRDGILVGFLLALAFGYGSTFPNIIHLIASHAIPVPVTVAVSVGWGLLALGCLTYDRLVGNKRETAMTPAEEGFAEAVRGAPRPAAGPQPQLGERGERQVEARSSARAQMWDVTNYALS